MIYLIDTIGKETGMNLYDEAFYDAFRKRGIPVIILSNFEGASVKNIIHNFYHGSSAKKILGLVISWLKILFFRLTHSKDIYVYQSFGLRVVDILFLMIFAWKKNLFVVVHDVFEITGVDKKTKKRKIQNFVYNHWIKNVICHSSQAIETLKKETRYCGRILFFPHFQYVFSKSYDERNVAKDVVQSIEKEKKNVLFFGQIRETKGIDILIDAFNSIAKMDDINVVIAGSDKKGLMKNVELPKNVKTICRYIEDDELKFLFLNCQAVLLPYKEIYQSGVLETVVYFQKYAILSDIRAFEEFSANFPSFGETYSPNDGKSLAMCIENFSKKRCEYSVEDLQKYEKDHDIDLLIKQMNLSVKI